MANGDPVLDSLMKDTPNRRPARARASLGVLATFALLGGCISLGSEPPESLLTLTSTNPVASRTVSGDAFSALVVGEFEAPASIAVTRVPVQIDDSRIAYLKDATWVERPSRLFRRLVAETIRDRTGRIVIDGDDPGVGASARLSAVLRQFGYDARTSTVMVMVDVAQSGEGSQVRMRRFSASVPGVIAEGQPVGFALNQAANTVAGEIADWVAQGAPAAPRIMSDGDAGENVGTN